MLPTDALQTCESCVESCAVYSHCDATRHKRRGQLPSSPIMLRHTLLMDLLLAIVSEIPSDSFLLPTARTTCYFPFNVATQFGTSGSAPAAQGMAGSTSVGESTLAIPKVDEGYDLNGILTIKNTESKSLWVVCHGLCSSSVGSVPRFVSNMLQANTFRFDFSGCGRSGGDWKYAGYNVSDGVVVAIATPQSVLDALGLPGGGRKATLRSLLRRECRVYFLHRDRFMILRELDDLRIVVLRLRELGWNVHGVLGHSKGAAAVLRYGERFDDVPLLVNVAGRFHTSATPRSRFSEEQWEQLEETGSFMWNVKGEDLPVTKEDFEERAGLDMKKTAESIKNAKVLTIHGEEDETIPVADAQEFDRHVAQHELVIVEGAGHSFLRDPERAAVIEALGRYLEDVGSTEAR